MNAADLLNHLSKFESIIVMNPDQLLSRLGGVITLLCQAGRFIIMLMFILYLVQKVVSNQAEDLKRNIVKDAVLLVVFLAIFGTTGGYGWFAKIMMNLYNLFAQNIFAAEMTAFKSQMRQLIDTIAESGKYGFDIFNIKAMAANVLAFLVSACIYLMIVTYYIFASVGMFFMLIAIAIGPVVAGFFFFIKRPIHNWLLFVFAAMMFPVISGISVLIINQSPLVTGIRQDIIVGSMLTLIIQVLMMILFMQFVLIFHAGLFGVSFFNMPVRVIGLVKLCCGIFDQHSVYEVCMIVLKKKRS